jgi:O-antigen ligase
MGDAPAHHSPQPSTRGTRHILQLVKWLSRALELGVYAVVFGSALAIGSVHPWAYVPLWWAGLGLAVLTGLRELAVWRLRSLVGPEVITLRGKTVLLGDALPDRWSWGLDLGARPQAPILLPGILFLTWVGLQLLPFGSKGPWTVSVPATMRGALFVATALAIHVAAASVFVRQQARRRFYTVMSVFGALLAIEALVQMSTGTRLVYGIFKPVESDTYPFGAFVNRNHFAGYMLLVLPLSMAGVARAAAHVRGSIARRHSLTDRLLVFDRPEARRVLYWMGPVFLMLGALLASASRGGALALVAAAVLIALVEGITERVATGTAVVGILIVAMVWIGADRLESRFGRAGRDAPARLLVWLDALHQIDDYWLTGSGFNTYGLSIGHTLPWQLPKGSAPWPQEIRQAVAAGQRPVIRVPPGLPPVYWYREAHNDYLQLLIETGLPGLGLAIWAAVRLLRQLRADRWLLMAAVGMLLHVLVEFDLQIPALPVLLVVVAACGRGRAHRGDPGPSLRGPRSGWTPAVEAAAPPRVRASASAWEKAAETAT